MSFSVRFLASYSLLHAGIETIGVRYGLAVAIACVFFLLLLWVWLRTSPGDYDGLDELMVEVVEAIPDEAGKVASRYQGDGGNFDGGGASNKRGCKPKLRAAG